jgi:hypothetical protein
MEILPPTPPSDDEDLLFAEARIRVFLSDYLRKEDWSPMDACLLVYLINPQDPSLHLISQGYHLPPKVEKLLLLARADAESELKTTVVGGKHRVRPADFLDWLNRRGITPPKLFAESVMAATSGRPLTAAQRGKQKTQEKYKGWNQEYAELLKQRPDLSKNSAARIIANQNPGRGNDSETVRKHLVSPPKKVGR